MNRRHGPLPPPALSCSDKFSSGAPARLAPCTSCRKRPLPCRVDASNALQPATVRHSEGSEMVPTRTCSWGRPAQLPGASGCALRRAPRPRRFAHAWHSAPRSPPTAAMVRRVPPAAPAARDDDECVGLQRSQHALTKPGVDGREDERTRFARDARRGRGVHGDPRRRPRRRTWPPSVVSREVCEACTESVNMSARGKRTARGTTDKAGRYSGVVLSLIAYPGAPHISCNKKVHFYRQNTPEVLVARID
eukprot:7387832-Prymnesium_polylepis.1